MAGGGGGGSNRWSGLWGLSGGKGSKMDSLVHQLDTYSRLGIPRVPHHMQLTHAPITLQDVDDEVEEGNI